MNTLLLRVGIIAMFASSTIGCITPNTDASQDEGSEDQNVVSMGPAEDARIDRVRALAKELNVTSFTFDASVVAPKSAPPAYEGEVLSLQQPFSKISRYQTQERENQLCAWVSRERFVLVAEALKEKATGKPLTFTNFAMDDLKIKDDSELHEQSIILDGEKQSDWSSWSSVVTRNERHCLVPTLAMMAKAVQECMLQNRMCEVKYTP